MIILMLKCYNVRFLILKINTFLEFGLIAHLHVLLEDPHHLLTDSVEGVAIIIQHCPPNQRFRLIQEMSETSVMLLVVKELAI